MKKTTVLTLIVLMLLSAVQAAAPYRSKLTNADLIARLKQLRKDKLPGKFIRLSPEVLKFEGYIDKGTHQDYLKSIDDRVKVLVINSLGGDTNSGVKMGMDIHKRKLTVMVEGAAASSAANYLFLGGEKKIIEKGFVGFHGNSQALLAQSGGFDKLKREMKEKYQVSDEYFAQFRKEIEESIKLEKEFFGQLKVPQKFFDITQEPGMGLSSFPDDGFDFLLPSLRTMQYYGIKNVSGRQDVGFAVGLGIKAIYY